MTGKIKVLLLLLIVLLAGCGSKTDDGLHIENHDWTSTQVIDSAGQPLDLPALTCSAQDGTLTLKAGVLQMKVKADEVRLIEEAERAATAKKQPQFAPSQRILRTASAARELDIRGMETLEAESVLDNYIDAAVMAHLETVTIIHGKGTGALRKAVHASLKRNKAVKSFRLGNYGEGESGVTVVELK